MSPKRLISRLFIGLHAALLGAMPALAADVSAAAQGTLTPRYDVGINPITMLGSNNATGGHALGAFTDFFSSPQLSLGINASYADSHIPSASDPSQPPPKFEVTRISTTAMEPRVDYYLRPSLDSWFFTFGVAFQTMLISGNVLGHEYDSRSNTIAPGGAAGYRWVFRHGGFITLCGGLQDVRVTSQSFTLRDGSSLTQEQRTLAHTASMVSPGLMPKADFGIGMLIGKKD